jgi:hypothetical protein
METKKICKACLKEKELSEFWKRKDCNDGYEPRCKLCHQQKIKIIPPYKEIVLNEEVRVCKACKQEKVISDFNKDRFRKDGVREKCRQCQKDKIYIVKDTQLIGKVATCRACFEEKDLSLFYKSKNKYETKCADCHKQNINIEKEVIYTDNKKRCSKCEIFKSFDQFYKSNTTRSKLNLTSSCIDCKKEYCNNNRQKLTESKRRYVDKNRDLVNEKERMKLKTNSFYKLKKYLRISIKHNLLNQNKKSKRTEEILGCSFEKFKIHIESQFLNWMNWDNYGNVCGTELEYNCSWDLDHIIPLSSETTEEGLIILNHWSNFQPLCSKINRDIKRNAIYPVTNLELKITKI